MRTVTYSSVVDKVSGYLGENSGMSAEDAGLCNRLINTFYKLAVEFYFWPELVPIEKRQFRPSYDLATDYGASQPTAAVEVYYPRAQKYYQSLQANTGQTPATGANLVENSAYWAECQGCYSGDDWAEGLVLTVGRIVRNPDDERFYQCISAHTAGATFDVSQFGILTEFVRSIDYEQSGQTALGEVKKVWDRNPDVNYNACPIAKVLRQDYLLVRGTQPVVWVEFRIRPNSFSQVAWASGTFAVGAVRYYSVTGECYVCIAPATSELPTDATKWTKLDFPYFLQEYVAQSVYAAMMSKEEQVPEDFTVTEGAGFPLLRLELQKIERQQGQVRQLNVVNAR